jgi:hypothetical protein
LDEIHLIAFDDAKASRDAAVRALHAVKAGGATSFGAPREEVIELLEQTIKLNEAIVSLLSPVEPGRATPN